MSNFKHRTFWRIFKFKIVFEKRTFRFPVVSGLLHPAVPGIFGGATPPEAGPPPAAEDFLYIRLNRVVVWGMEFSIKSENAEAVGGCDDIWRLEIPHKRINFPT